MKIGRNEPCPCGSGKKYKQCCLKKEHHKKEQAATGQAEPGTGSHAIEQDESPPARFQPGMDQLIEKGLLRAPQAVTVTRSIPRFFVMETPVINLLRCYLEFIVREGGSVHLPDSGKVLEDLPFDPGSLLELMVQWPHIDTSLRDRADSPAALKFILWARYLSSELGLTVENRTSISLTDKGTSVLGTADKLRQLYKSCLKEVTERFNWFALPELPEQFEIIQDIIGFTMLTLFHRTRDLQDPLFDPAELFSIIDTTFSLSERMRGEGIRTKEVREVFIDYSFLYYGYLMGFVEVEVADSSDAKGRLTYHYRTTELFRYLFQWQI